MTRRSKSSKTNKEEVRLTLDGLKHPYPRKAGSGKFVIYCDTKKQDEDHPRVFIPIFAEAYAAARLLKVLIGNDEYEPVQMISRFGILTSSGVRITAFGEQTIKHLLTYEPTAGEALWRDETMEQNALRLKLGSQWEEPKRESNEETTELEPGSTRVKTKKEKREKVPKEVRPKLDRTGMVTATDLAARLKIEPRIFRGALRALKKEKPEGGWLWTKSDAEEIFKEVTKQLKK